MRIALWVAGGLSLAACSPVSKPVPAASAITVTQDQVRLAGPRGFCVDGQSSQIGSSDAFVVFGNCASISGLPDQPQPIFAAVVTVSVSNGGGFGLPAKELERYFKSDAGLSILATGDAPVEVLKTSIDDGALFVRTKSGDTLSWRAFLQARNSVITMSILNPDGRPTSDALGLHILEDFAEAIKSGQSPLPGSS